MSSLTDASAQLEAAVDAVLAVDPAVRSDGDAVTFLHRQLARLDAATTQSAASFDAGRSWEADGARSAAAWIATRCHLPTSAARRRVRLGRELRHMPSVEAAWLAGDIGEAHVGLLARARTPGRAEAFAGHEAMLVGYARSLRFGAFARALAYWCYLADPDGSEQEADDDHKARRFHLSQGFRGTYLAEGVFDAIGGAIFEGELKRLEQELFDADWAEARARVGPGVCAADLSRTPAQRRADAVVEMARRSGAMPAGARMPEPLFNVFIGYEMLAGRICELANGTAVTPGSLLPYLDAAWIERVVFGSPSRVIDIGVRRRLFTGATRRAVQLRDRECFHEFCDTPAADCQVDHIEPYAAGGPTTQDNGRSACGFHNRERHRRP